MDHPDMEGKEEEGQDVAQEGPVQDEEPGDDDDDDASTDDNKAAATTTTNADDDTSNQDDDDEEEVQEKESALDGGSAAEKDDDDDKTQEKLHERSHRESSIQELQEEKKEDDDDDASSAASSSGSESGSSSSEDDSSSDEEEEEQGTGVARMPTTTTTDADGRQLSEYELLRIERIERNRQYLAKLGLEKKDSNSSGGFLANNGAANQNDADDKPKGRRKKKPVDLPPRRSSIARSTKGKCVRYTLPPISEVLRGVDHADNKNDDDDDDRKPAAKKRDSSHHGNAIPGRPKSQSQRMDLVIHREFLRIRSEKRTVLKQAEKNVRAAEKEVSYWGKRVAAVERAEQRKLQEKSRTERLREFREQERKVLGGFTSKEMCQEYDKRLPELQEAAKKYDDVFLAAEREKEKEAKRVEMEKKMQLIGALERYPRAMRDAHAVLNSVLLERAPKNPPPPRRSKRTHDDAIMEDGNAADDAAPTSPKKKKAKKGHDSSSPKAGDNMPAAPVLLAEEEDNSNNNNGNKTTTSSGKASGTLGRKPKRVGGWVQPGFAQTIDRAWLNKDTASADVFRLAEYVPQIGDAVLYYPIGHAEYLEQYPDILAKKTRNLTRIPLWERAVSDRKKSEDGKKQSSPSSPASSSPTEWWTDEWVEGIRGDKGKCPILCVVQGTCAEFPPDVKDKNQGEKDKSKHQQRGSHRPQLRLAVTLRALTPVDPSLSSSSSSSSSQGSESSLPPVPPLFSVVTFPSRLRPFLVPFSWAYTIAHSLSLGQTVQDKSKPNSSQLRIGSFDSAAKRLDDNIPGVESIRKKFGEKGAARKFSLINTTSDDSRSLPVGDALVVLETFDRFVEERKAESSELDASTLNDDVDLLALIGSTLPIWDSITVVTGAGKRIVSVLSPWEVRTARQANHAANASPERLVEVSSSFDEALRLKIECALEDQLKQMSQTAGSFIDAITDLEAANYSCAVPVTMCFSRILKRLKPKAKGRRNCYYRSVGSVLSDIVGILDNCLLYNHPDAEIVDDAIEVISSVKDGISRLVRNHNKELCATRKADEERQRLVMLHCTSGNADASDPSGNASSSKSMVVCRVRDMYKQPLHRNWLQEVVPVDPVITKSTSKATERSEAWIPQAGDRVMYCRELHAGFVKGHYRSLEAEQCCMPPPIESPAGTDAEGTPQVCEPTWRRGLVVWTRAVFPKLLSKKSDDDAHTFRTSSTLLAMGVRFESDSKEVHVIHWRPCLFGIDGADKGGVCPSCNVESFLRHDPAEKENVASTDEVRAPSPSPLSKIECDSIDRCVSLLKRRCLSEIPPSYIDSKLTKANIKQGFVPPHTKIGLKSLPTYEDLLTANASETETGHDTRRSNTLPKPVDPLLLQSGYVPTWISESPPSKKSPGPRFHETVSPWPSLCLELIQLRLKQGYYRHRTAIENDIVEAFASSVFLLLAEAAGCKKSPLSIKRVARLLSMGKDRDNVVEQEGTDKTQKTVQGDGSLANSEEEWASRLRPIRELYATALVCVSETNNFERLCGLVAFAPPQKPASPDTLIHTPQQDPVQADARKKLALLQRCLARDELLNTFGRRGPGGSSAPEAMLKITCGGKVVSHKKLIVTTTKTLDADIKGKAVRTRIFLGGREFAVKEEDLNGEEVDLTKPVAGTRLQSSGPEYTRKIESVVQNSTCFSLHDFEKNESLARLFYGRPQRMNPCARCHANMRSMAACRVLKSHSNPDFDWTDTMQGVGGIEGLLKALDPDYKSQGDEEAVTTAADGAVPNESADVNTANAAIESIGANPASSVGDSASAAAGANENGTTEAADDGEGKETLDPKETAEKAEKALSLARELLAQAKAFYDAPDRMSKEFVKSDVPVDPADGKKIYCILCGLSGDLLCCDGCPNVVHQACVELKDVPEGDWFCEECVNRQSETTESQREDEKPDLHFGRTTFDLERSDGLTSTLQDLRDLHIIRKKRKRDANDDAGSDDENGLSDPFNVLSSMTQRFLASIGITTAEELINARTSDVGEEFVQWRKEEGMAELKGSGRVASVSMWKRAVKDMAVEMGVPLSDEAVPDTPRRNVNDDDDSDEAGSSTEVPQKKRRRQKSLAADETTDWSLVVDEALDVLSATTKSFLYSEGITTCEQFLGSRTSELAALFVTWRKQQGMPPLKVNGSGASVSAWKAACRQSGLELGWDVHAMERRMSTSRRETSSASQKSLGTKHVGTPGSRKSKGQADTPRSERAQRRLEETDNDNSEPVKPASRRARNANVKCRGSLNKNGKNSLSSVGIDGDPICVLDDMPLRFLRSIGIETAEALLSLRTCEVATKYKPWRRKQGLPELKGSGDGAHVSAWKSLCKKASKSWSRNASSSEETTDTDGNNKDDPEEASVSGAASATRSEASEDDGEGPTVDDSSVQSQASSGPYVFDVEDAIEPRARKRARTSSRGTISAGEEDAPIAGPADVENESSSGASRRRRPPPRFADIEAFKK